MMHGAVVDCGNRRCWNYRRVNWTINWINADDFHNNETVNTIPFIEYYRFLSFSHTITSSTPAVRKEKKSFTFVRII